MGPFDGPSTVTFASRLAGCYFIGSTLRRPFFINTPPKTSNHPQPEQLKQSTQPKQPKQPRQSRQIKQRKHEQHLRALLLFRRRTRLDPRHRSRPWCLRRLVEPLLQERQHSSMSFPQWHVLISTGSSLLLRCLWWLELGNSPRQQIWPCHRKIKQLPLKTRRHWHPHYWSSFQLPKCAHPPRRAYLDDTLCRERTQISLEWPSGACRRWNRSRPRSVVKRRRQQAH